MAASNRANSMQNTDLYKSSLLSLLYRSNWCTLGSDHYAFLLVITFLQAHAAGFAHPALGSPYLTCRSR
jgi:hypothetical protein